MNWQIHSHKCECGKIWVHDSTKIDEDNYEKEHTCPDCGKEQWWKHCIKGEPEFPEVLKQACRVTL